MEKKIVIFALPFDLGKVKILMGGTRQEYNEIRFNGSNFPEGFNEKKDLSMPRLGSFTRIRSRLEDPDHAGYLIWLNLDYIEKNNSICPEEAILARDVLLHEVIHLKNHLSKNILLKPDEVWPEELEVRFLSSLQTSALKAAGL